MTRVDMDKVNRNIDKRRVVGRKRMGPPPLSEGPRSKVDFKRICKELGFGSIPPNISEMSLVDLWNDTTDYYLPRIDDRGKPLKMMSKPVQDRVDEVEMMSKPVQDRVDEVELWRDVGTAI